MKYFTGMQIKYPQSDQEQNAFTLKLESSILFTTFRFSPKNTENPSIHVKWFEDKVYFRFDRYFIFCAGC